jgi:hypothetical protein
MRKACSPVSNDARTLVPATAKIVEQDAIEVTGRMPRARRSRSRVRKIPVASADGRHNGAHLGCNGVLIGVPQPSMGLPMMRSAKWPSATMHSWPEPMWRDWKATICICTEKPPMERVRNREAVPRHEIAQRLRWTPNQIDRDELTVFWHGTLGECPGQCVHLTLP